MAKRTRPWNRVSAAIIATAALAVLGSVAALLLPWQIAALFHSAVSENIPALHAAEEIANQLDRAIDQHVGRGELRDDVTAVVIKVRHETDRRTSP